MAGNFYAKICTNCGFDNAGDELGIPCRKCSSQQFQVEFRGPMSAGAGTVIDIPLHNENPQQTLLTTQGGGEVTLGGTTISHTFALFPKIKRKNGHNWVQIGNRRDRKGLDVLFGSRQAVAHAHYCYEVGPSMIYLRDLSDTRLLRKHLFDRSDGSVLPIADEIQDVTTGMSLVISFVVRDDEILIETVEFVPTRKHL